MTLLVRRLDKPNLWSGTEGFLKDPSDFPYFLMGELADGAKNNKKGLSFFEIKSRRRKEIARIAAATYLSSQAQDHTTYQFRVVEASALDSLGITYTKSSGDLCDGDLNAMHYDVTDLDGAKAAGLIRLLCRSNPLILNFEEICKACVLSIKSSNITALPKGKKSVADLISAKALQPFRMADQLVELARVLRAA